MMKNLTPFFVEEIESKATIRKTAFDQSTHLLVIRLSAMGDVAMTIPVLSALLAQYPKLRITFLTRKFFSPMFASLPQVSVFEADLRHTHKGLFGLWRLFRALKSEQPDAVADLHNVLRSKLLKFFFSFTTIPVRQIDKGRKEKRALTAKKNKIFRPLKSTHERYADVFRTMGFTFSLEQARPQPKRAINNDLSTKTGARDRIWAGIAPFAAYKGKMYPLDLMERVLEDLVKTKRYKIFLFGGGKEETDLLQQMEKRYTNAAKIAGNLNFEEELSLISQLDIMISMDSGNGHLAAVFGVPVLTIWGVTHPYAGFSPFGQHAEYAILPGRAVFPAIPTSVYGNKFPEGYDTAIATITPEAIVRKIEEIVAATSG